MPTLGRDRSLPQLKETAMRPAIFYYLAHTLTADRRRQAQRDEPAGAASQTRHRRTPWRRYRNLMLLAAVKRRANQPEIGEFTDAPTPGGLRSWPS